MSKQAFFLSLSTIGLASLLTVTSFFVSETSYSQPGYREDQPELNSSGRQSKQKDHLTLSTAFENDYYLRNKRTGHFYAELVSDNYRSSNERHVPLNLSVVIDRSGSMAGDKIRNAKLAAHHIVDQLGADDYISIVIYDQQVDVLQSAVRVLNKEQIKRKIDGIVDRGNTNLMGGASEGYNQVERNYDSRYVNRVLLLSDGLANQGITSQPQIEKIVREKSRKNGISISTFGVGRDYNEDLMTAMAETGNGNYYFIDKPADISGIFRQELNFLQDVIAQRAELRVTIPEFVRIDQVYGQSYTQQGRTLIINLHDIFSDETRGALVRYTVLPGYTMPVHFSTTLNYQESGYNQKRSIHMNNYSNYTSSEYTYRNSSNEWVATQIALYHSNERMEQALKEVDKGNYSEAKKIIQSNKEYLSAQPKSVQEAPAMQKVVTINENYDTQLDDVQSMNEDEIKYMQKDAKNSNYKVRAKKK